jgi:integrase
MGVVTFHRGVNRPHTRHPSICVSLKPHCDSHDSYRCARDGYDLSIDVVREQRQRGQFPDKLNRPRRRRTALLILDTIHGAAGRNRWSLHKFRRTFATMHHESGVSGRTLQAWLGHSNLETTLLYLKVADLRSDRIRLQVDSTFREMYP